MSNEFLNLTFPDRIASAASVALQFSTKTAISNSGQEFRIAERLTPITSYDLSGVAKNRAEVEQLTHLFRLSCGMAKSFRFRDPLHHQLQSEVLALGDGATTKFSIIKTYSLNGLSVQKQIKLIRSDPAPVVMIDDILVPLDRYLIDYLNGQLSFITSATPLEWQKISISCVFDTMTRFTSDSLAIELVSRDMFRCNNLGLVEVL